MKTLILILVLMLSGGATAQQYGLPGGGTGNGTGPQGPAGANGQGFTNRGAWSASTAYSAYDVLTNAGQTYLVTANFTSPGSFTTTNLLLWAAKGIDGSAGSNGSNGAAGQGFTNRGAWTASTAYSTYDVLTNGGQTYLVTSGFTSPGSFTTSNLLLWASKGADGANGSNGTSAPIDNETAGAGGVTINTLVSEDTSAPTKFITAAVGSCGAGTAASTVAANASFVLNDLNSGAPITVIVDVGGATAQHLLIGSTVTAGDVMDSGQTSSNNIPIGTTICGVALATASGGATVSMLPRARGSVGKRIVRSIAFQAGSPGGSALSPGILGYLTVPVGCTIGGWSIQVDAGTATVKWLKVAAGTAIPTIGSNSISTSGVAISTGTVIQSTTLTDFTSTAVTANDIIAADITATTGAGYVAAQLVCQ